MKIKLIVVGKTTDRNIVEGISDYIGRIKHYIPFELVVIPELKNTKKLSVALQKEQEGCLILKQLQPTDSVVLLDEHGKEWRSIEFASWIEKQQQSTKCLVFVVGGPYGFSDSVYARANGKLSLSKMTFSHQMIRLLFVEQIYRAYTIISGQPYHHE